MCMFTYCTLWVSSFFFVIVCKLRDRYDFILFYFIIFYFILLFLSLCVCFFRALHSLMFLISSCCTVHLFSMICLCVCACFKIKIYSATDAFPIRIQNTHICTASTSYHILRHIHARTHTHMLRRARARSRTNHSHLHTHTQMHCLFYQKRKEK